MSLILSEEEHRELFAKWTQDNIQGFYFNYVALAQAKKILAEFDKDGSTWRVIEMLRKEVKS